MKAINRAFEEKVIPQTHVSLGALKERINANVEGRSAGLHWNAEVELDRENTKTCSNLFLLIVALVEIMNNALQSNDIRHCIYCIFQMCS